MDKTITPSVMRGSITIPGSKSEAIRALLIATFARGVSRIKNLPESEDVKTCIGICESLGASVRKTGGYLKLDSLSLSEGEKVLDCRNSGTTLTLAAAMCATLNRKVVFTGDEQLKKRPVGALLSSLEDLGCKTGKFCTVKGPIRGGTTSIECPTSQFLSALLLGCPNAENRSTITVPLLNEKPYVRMTLRWLDNQHIRYRKAEDLSFFEIEGNQRFTPFEYTVPGDWSSAGFFCTIAAMKGNRITLKGLDLHDEQGDKEVLSILRQMGAKITARENEITIEGADKLKGGRFDLNAIPDTLPALAALAAKASEPVTLFNVAQARIKETDRIHLMTAELTRMGARITEHPDGMTIYPSKLHGARVDGHKDHRIVMALSTLAHSLDSESVIESAEAADITFPGFFTLCNTLRRR